jgi:hypothetical protein
VRSQLKTKPADEFARFHALTKRVVSVPKAEVDRRAKEHKEARAAKKQAKADR